MTDPGPSRRTLRSRAHSLLARTFRSAGTRNFRLFLGGQAVSAVGIWVQRVAELWLVLQLTESSIAVGLVTTLNFAPVLLFGPWGGLVADRTDKRRLLMITQAARAVPAFGLAAMTLTGAVTPGIVYMFAAATGVATALDNPARRVFLQEMVGRDLAANAVSLNSTLMTTARVIGPTIAGVLIAWVGIGWCFALNGLTYLGVVLSLNLMDADRLSRMPIAPRDRGQLRAGFRYAVATPAVRDGLFMLALVATFAWGTLEVLIPLLVAFAFQGDASAFAGLFAVMSAGALLGALSSAARLQVRIEHAAVAAVGLGLALVATAAASTPVVAGLLLFVVGVAGAWFVTTDNAVVLVASADEYTGRTLALYSTLQLGGRSVGGVLVGLVASLTGPRGAFVFAGAAALLAGLPVLVARRVATARAAPTPPP